MRNVAFIVMVILMVARWLPAQQPDQSGTATAIRALEHEWVEGQSRNDNRALDLIFDNSLVYVEYGNLVSKGEYLSRVKSTASPRLSQIVTEDMSVRIFGGTAIVVGTYRERFVGSGKRQLGRWRFIDTWIYKKNGWVLVAAAAAPMPQS